MCNAYVNRADVQCMLQIHIHQHVTVYLQLPAPTTMSCCPPTTNGTKPPHTNSTTPSANGDHDDIRSSVANYYSKVLSTSADLKTTACCTATRPPPSITRIIATIPHQVNDKYYGCGLPPMSGMAGLDVCDLGCGSGRDCYILAALVGPHGTVTGIDMTDEQLAVAKQYAQQYTTEVLKYEQCNMQFDKQYIEMITHQNQFDLITSNCVINLSPCKSAVLAGVWQALKDGGEFYFSDIYSDRRIPGELRTHPTLLGECLAGALYIHDFVRLAAQAGFVDCRVVDSKPVQVQDEELKELTGNIKFTSITYRLFKFDASSADALETLCEDYGQVAVYNGGIDGHKHSYALDNHHMFYTGKPMLVCGNTASMVGKSRTLGKHFTVTGNRTVHHGLFNCSSPEVQDAMFDELSPSRVSGACC